MITFKCPCGKALKVKDDAAGKRVRCPACSEVIEVPAPSAAAPPSAAAKARAAKGAVVDVPEDDADFGLQAPEPELGEHKVEGEAKHCPACHMPLAKATVICTTCGYDYRTGKAYEQPKSVVEKVPWKLIGKWVVQIAMIALVVALGLWAYKKMTAAKEGDPEPSQEGEEVGGTSSELQRRARYIKRKPAIRVVTKTTYLKPRPPDGFTLTAADGKYTASKACSLLRSKLAAEVRDRMRVVGHKVLKPKEKASLTASAVLKLRLEVTIGWAFAERDGKLVPTQPYVASCNATIVRKDDSIIWPVKGESASYSAKRPGPAPGKDAAAAIAALKEATTDVSLDQATDTMAATVRGKILHVVPPPNFLAKLLAAGGRKPKGE